VTSEFIKVSICTRAYCDVDSKDATLTAVLSPHCPYGED
jgi:hypothetical protein